MHHTRLSSTHKNSKTAIQFEMKCLKDKFWIWYQNHDFAGNGEKYPGSPNFGIFSETRVHSFADKCAFRNLV